MKKILLLIAALFFAASLQAKGDLHLFSVDNKDEKITPYMIEEALNKNGLHVELNSNMIGPFKKQFKETKYKIFTLMTFWSKKYTRELVNKYPKAGAFTPMGMGIYQARNEDTLHFSVLTAEAQGKILGIQDPLLKKIEAQVLAVIKKNFPKAKHTLSEDSLKTSHNLVTTYEMEVDEDEDIDDVQDEFIMNLEAGFKPFGFVVPEYMDLNEVLTEDGKVESPYDFYLTYSICKLPVIYTVSKTRPEASAFAPCTTIIYKKKNENKVVVGFPAVYNWLSSAKVENKDAKKELLKAQKDFESILKDITE
ncbi:DUF302 domain-containing protein [Sulfurimonas autotrophica]|uniref:DUF302 domain-containing protein n=1 Tax=Sulfurimonas autotrophica (strain ATCC BAA-671 / DSM 16294 / JCM 11897 / OK10) TaxID=563040 RepID=E0US26_SULAO|nr:DUF302 domain-containing protein [Sulfurimonas autotrophica]ADN09049.1 conserved hypothetical protein [Sulfurimonas autotrophica DSM 16294]